MALPSGLKPETCWLTIQDVSTFGEKLEASPSLFGVIIVTP